MLPAEIRYRIWTLAVVNVGEVIVRCNRCPKPSGKPLSPTTMSLASTCCQIYREVTPIYYSKNVFCLFSPMVDLLWQFAVAIGPANAKSITTLEIPWNFRTGFISLGRQKKQPFSNLKTFWIRNPEAEYEYLVEAWFLNLPESDGDSEKPTTHQAKEPRS